jgi:hypothetical protein
MEPVRYKPGEAIRWLKMGAEDIRKEAKERARSVVNQTGTEQRPFTHNLKTAAGALLDFGKSAYADAVHTQALGTEYVLDESHFDVVHGTTIKTIPYERVKGIEMRGDRAQLVLDKGTMNIKPVAHLVAGRVRVPVGWIRNGTEVPYELLVEELAARCGVEVEG